MDENKLAAFPTAHGQRGMSKREHMATQILSGMVANSDPDSFGRVDSSRERAAQRAVSLADALIWELGK